MSASQRACRKLANWLTWCAAIGWQESDMPALADLWWEHHDEDSGELKERHSPQNDSLKERT